MNAKSAELPKRRVERFGWVPDIPDARDYMYSAPEAVSSAADEGRSPSAMPARLRPGTARELHRERDRRGVRVRAAQAGQKDFMPSRLFIYYNERVMEGTIDTDSGAMIRDGMKSVAKLGVCPKTIWPYDIAQVHREAARAAYTEAKKHQATRLPARIANLHQMQGCLASGLPVRVRLHRLRELRERGGGEDRQGADAAARARSCSAATPCWRSATTTRTSGSSSATRGGRSWGMKGYSRCRTPT